MNKYIKYFGLFLVSILMACSEDNNSSKAVDTSTKNSQNVVKIVAGSELKDLKDMTKDMEKAVGSKLQITYLGTLESVDHIEEYDIAWLSSDKYAKLVKPDSIKATEKTMLSPVIMGIKSEKAHELGWDKKPPSWQDISKAAEEKRFSYAVTNPTTSNTGFSALMGVAAAFAGNSDALTVNNLNQKKMSAFFSGVGLVAGSSGWLADDFMKNNNVDGMINYESVLLSLNKQGANLTLVYPKEGIVTSDYPLILVNNQKKEAYDKLVSFIKSQDTQTNIMNQTFRRPVVTLSETGNVNYQKLFPNDQILVELPFPKDLTTVDGILDSYLEDIKIPSRIILVLDTSGSMSENNRMINLKQALQAFAGKDKSLTGRFAKFRNRDDVYIVPFSSNVGSVEHISFSSINKNAQMQDYSGMVNQLEADGGTAIYDALATALNLHIQTYKQDKNNNENHYTTILLFTDGENNHGKNFAEFAKYYKDNLENAKPVKIFPILFGEGSATDMANIAKISNGKVFDGQKTNLVDIFKEIRGYQ